MAKFDLEKHKAGRKARTISGDTAEWVCSVNDGSVFSEVFKITHKKGKQFVRPYTISGHYYSSKRECDENLELESEKVTLYVNVYQCPDNTFYVGTHYLSLVSAREGVSSSKDFRYIKTVPIEIEI